MSIDLGMGIAQTWPMFTHRESLCAASQGADVAAERTVRPRRA